MRPPIGWHTLAPMLIVITVVPLIAAILIAPIGKTFGVQQIPVGFLVEYEIAKRYRKEMLRQYQLSRRLEALLINIIIVDKAMTV